MIINMKGISALLVTIIFTILEHDDIFTSALTLSSTAPASNHVCPGQEVIFTCSTENSPTIAWASIEYIDFGSQLEFAVFNMPGDMRMSPINPGTVATLVENGINEDGRRILISELRLIVLPQFPLFSIACFHANGTGITTTISIQGNPSMPQNVTVKQNIMVERYTGNSSCTISIAWITPRNVTQDDISHYTIYINESINYYIFSNTTTSDQNLILTSYPVCTCAEHQVSVSAVNVCDREGQRSPNIIPNLDPLSYPIMCEFTPTINPGSEATDNTDPTVTAILVIYTITITIMLMISITISIIYVCFVRRFKN